MQRSYFFVPHKPLKFGKADVLKCKPANKPAKQEMSYCKLFKNPSQELVMDKVFYVYKDEFD